MPMPPSIDMSRQYPPGHPWHDATPSQLRSPSPRSVPWLNPLDQPTIHTPSSPYRPWTGEEVGSEGFYAPPPPEGNRNSGPAPRRRPNVLMAVIAVLVVGVFVVATVFISKSRPPASSVLAAVGSPTAILSSATTLPTQTAGTPAPSPTVGVHTPTPSVSPTVTPTKVATATPVPAPPVTYDDTATGTGTNQFNYQGIWAQSADAGYYNGTDSYSNDASGYVTFSFTGTRIQLIIDTNYNIGIMGISLDNGAEQDKDGYSANLTYQVPIYSSGVLTKGPHTLKVWVTGRKGGGSDTYIDIDAVKVTP